MLQRGEEGSNIIAIVLWTNGKIGSFSGPTGVVWSRVRLRRTERDLDHAVSGAHRTLTCIYRAEQFKKCRAPPSSSPLRALKSSLSFLLLAECYGHIYEQKLIHFLKAEIQMNNFLKGGASYTYILDIHFLRNQSVLLWDSNYSNSGWFHWTKNF